MFAACKPSWQTEAFQARSTTLLVRPSAVTSTYNIVIQYLARLDVLMKTSCNHDMTIKASSHLKSLYTRHAEESSEAEGAETRKDENIKRGDTSVNRAHIEHYFTPRNLISGFRLFTTATIVATMPKAMWICFALYIFSANSV